MKWVGIEAVAKKVLQAGDGNPPLTALQYLGAAPLAAPLQSPPFPDGWKLLVRAAFLQHNSDPVAPFRNLPSGPLAGILLEYLVDDSLTPRARRSAATILVEWLGAAPSVLRFVDERGDSPHCMSGLTSFETPALRAAWAACADEGAKRKILEGLLTLPNPQDKELLPIYSDVATRSEMDNRFRRAAIRALGSMGDRRMIRILTDILEAGGPLAIAAARSLSMLPMQEVVQLLAKAANDQHRPVPLRCACVYALGCFSPPMSPGAASAGGHGPWADKLTANLQGWIERCPDPESRPADVEVVHARLLVAVAAEVHAKVATLTQRPRPAPDDDRPCSTCGGRGFSEEYTMPSTGRQHLHANAYDVMRERTKKKIPCSSCGGAGILQKPSPTTARMTPEDVIVGGALKRLVRVEILAPDEVEAIRVAVRRWIAGDCTRPLQTLDERIKRELDLLADGQD